MPGPHDGVILLPPAVPLALPASPLGDAVHHLAGGAYPATRSTQVPMLRDVTSHCVLNSVVKEKALVGASSVIVITDCETDGSFYSTSVKVAPTSSPSPPS